MTYVSASTCSYPHEPGRRGCVFWVPRHVSEPLDVSTRGRGPEEEWEGSAGREGTPGNRNRRGVSACASEYGHATCPDDNSVTQRVCRLAKPAPIHVHSDPCQVHIP